MWITKTSIDNPVFATMVMVAITVLGVFSYQSLSIEQMPDAALPFVFVQTQYPGASPEVVETDVTKPIEYAINQVSGVKRVYSTTREGRSEVVAEFRLSTDVATAVHGFPTSTDKFRTPPILSMLLRRGGPRTLRSRV